MSKHRNPIYRITIIVLSLCLIVGFSPMSGFAADNHVGSSSKVTLNETDPFDFSTVKAKKALIKSAEDLPETFDLRNVDGKSYITPVKFQNPFGSCWGFAAIGAAETSILSSPVLNDPDNPAYSTRVGMKADDEGKDQDGKEILDLSEKHLSYFASSYLDDPESPQNGEGTHHIKGTSASDIMNLGGNPVLATNSFAAGLGPNLENRTDPNNLDPETHQPASLKELLTYKGKNGYKDMRDFDGGYKDFCYSADDDWSIDKDYRFYQSFVLKQSYMLPEPASLNEYATTYKYNPAGTAAIKEQLYAKRGVEIGFMADTSSPNQELGEDGTYLSTKNWAHYTWEPSWANHAVQIVGWDDNYPRENFIAEHQPPADMFPDGRHEGATDGGNGAWLVKNSWGSGEEDFPNKGEGNWGLYPGQDKAPYEKTSDVHTGYFWISYYDQSISMPEALEFDKANTDGYELDQLDYMQVHFLLATKEDKETKMANVFTAEKCETLEQVSCMTTSPNTEVSYEVYLLADYAYYPENGVKMATIDPVTYDYGGFHKESLDEPVLIQKGQRYSIVVTQKTEDGKYTVNTPAGKSKESSGLVWDKGIINPEESYVLIDGEWEDYSDEDVQKKVFDETQLSDPVFDNFPIKGFCKETGKNIAIRLSDEGVSLPIFRDWTKTVKLRFTGSGAADLPENINIKWSILNDDESNPLAYIEPLNDNKSAIRLTGNRNRVGESFLIADVEGVGTSAISLDAFKFAPSVAQFIDEDAQHRVIPQKYTGKPVKPEVKVLIDDPYYELLNEGTEYELKYVHNTKCGSGGIKITGTGDYMEHAGFTEYFPILPPKAEITKLNKKPQSLTVKVRDQKDTGITGYQARYRAKGASKWKTKKFKAGSASLALTGLEPGKRYQVQVRGYVDIPPAKRSWSMNSTYYGDYSKVNTSTVIMPKGTSIKNLTGGKKKITVKWKKQTGKITGYQLRLSLKKNFSKVIKTVTVKNAKTVKKVIKNLKAKKRYYVQIRTYKKAGGKTYRSKWSGTKSVMTK